jgi:serine/threonine protein kinase
MEDAKQTIRTEEYRPSKYPKLVNQGTFGCIYKPSFLCDGKTLKEEEYISKIQTKDDISQQEETIGNKIKELRNTSEHFAGIVNTCPIELSKIEDNELKKCDFIEKQTGNETPQEYVASTIKYVGKQDVLDYFIARINKPQQYVMSLFHIHFHLLKALTQLQEAKIIHYDLKSNNIMVHDVKKTPIMIDFGISFQGETKPEDASDVFYVYGPDYSPWCLDIHLISYALHKINSENPLQEKVEEEQIQEVIKDYVDTNSAVNSLTNTEKTEMRKAWNEYLSSYIGQTWETLYEALWNARWSWDNYAVALIMLKYTRGEFKIKENEFNQQYVKLLKQIIKATPDARLDAKSAKEELLEVMKMSKQEKRKLIESSKEKMLKDREHNMLTHKKESLLETRHTQRFQ